MSDINLNLYKTFYVVAQSKSYSDASSKLHLSVPSISVNINKLEDLLNAKLFYREKDGVKLTGDGRELFEIVEKALTSLDLGEKLLLHKNDLSNGEINIGCLSHIMTSYLMDYVEKAKKDYPNLKINLVGTADSSGMLQLLENHTVDFVIDIVPVSSNYNNNIVTEELKVIHNIFVSKTKLKIEDIKDFEKFEFILNFDNTLTNRGLRETLEKNNIYINTKIQSDITEARIDAVKRNLGIGYVIRESVEKELEEGSLFEVEVPIELPVTHINLVYMKEQLTRADKQFIKKYLKN